jgi:Type I phosphodiesterase / nucleotide pyrophosphatase
MVGWGMSSTHARAALAVALLAAACDAPAASGRAPTRDRGDRGLVVLLVIDQWPQWAFVQKRPQLRAGGFDRLLAEGKWQLGRYPSGTTLTAPGHALLGTGETTDVTGIVANEWWHRDLGRALASVRDARGQPTTRWLRVPGLGDAVASAGRGGKAVAVSLKDRAALLPLGHTGTAIWYSAKTVDWTSSTPRPWLQAWNRREPIALHLHDVWTPLEGADLRALSGRRDYEIGEAGDKGLGPTFPHQLDATPLPAEAVVATPLGNQLVLDTAIAAVAGEQLGADDVPDLLVVSLSAHDYIAHAWGHESWEAWDAARRLDQQLAQFLAQLDRDVGAGRWAMIVTSDHGAGALPELQGAGRIHYQQIIDTANTAAARALGPGSWIAFAKVPTLYLTEAARTSPKVDAAIDEIVRAMRARPGIARVERTRDLVGGCAARGADEALCRGLDAERSGEVLYVPAPGWLMEEQDEPVAASHGTPYRYDQEVPVIALPFGRVSRAPQPAPAGELLMTEIAPTLARWLGVLPPRELPR